MSVPSSFSPEFIWRSSLGQDKNREHFEIKFPHIGRSFAWPDRLRYKVGWKTTWQKSLSDTIDRPSLDC